MQFEFPGEDPPHKRNITEGNFTNFTIPTKFFITNNKLMVSLLHKGMPVYLFYGDINTTDNEIITGSMRTISGDIPFYPRWQSGDDLIGYVADETGESNGKLVIFNIDY